ncbi:hypothetical protein [Shouchella shacheensis]|uniref:hypothetical protein n=1 Tax=Shouchella shacheensis TaxID=1649580 RepID=UPI000A656547|nr:hypothetical protein [Shouchella shacheensis]
MEIDPLKRLTLAQRKLETCANESETEELFSFFQALEKEVGVAVKVLGDQTQGTYWR